MRFQPVKCNMMQLTRKHLNKIQASYTLEGVVIENVDNIKYLGVTIPNDLKWNTHISNICTEANRTLGFLKRTLFSCPQNVNEAAYKGMVWPILEYGSSVWDPHTGKLQDELEKVQNLAARFVTRNYVYESGSMNGILGQLKWEILSLSISKIQGIVFETLKTLKNYRLGTVSTDFLGDCEFMPNILSCF